MITSRPWSNSLRVRQWLDLAEGSRL